MHMVQLSEQWLALNAMYCNRYHARMTPIQCEANRQRVDACRCNGCGGLEEQEREIERQEPVVFFSDEPEDLDPEPMKQALAEALQEALDCNDDEFPLDDLEELEEETEGELTGIQRQLMALLGDDIEEEIVERKPAKKERRFMVFKGRCPRCQGYMINIPERYDDIRDDDVHRCFNCGYRSSPGYTWNRMQGHK